MAKFLSIFALIFAATLLHPATATTHVVGDSLGWTVPPGGAIAYSTWAATKIFRVGDIIEFNFTNGRHDVLEVTKAGFDDCNGNNSIGSILTTSPVRITLDSEGEHYYICTFSQHCPLGQKLAINVISASSPVTYTVGDSLGWTIPPGGEIAYQTWAFNKTFLVGDTLLFNFTTGRHTVAEVTKSGFDSCNGTSPIGSVQTDGPARFTLQSEGSHYYICTVTQHCPLGQKLAINVTGTANATPPSGSAPSPSGSGGAVPPTPGSASTHVVTGFSLAAFSIVIAFLY